MSLPRCSATSEEIERLRRIIHQCPIIDHHAHPILDDEHLKTLPLETLFSEAQDDALKDAPHSYAADRAISMLANVYNCQPTISAVRSKMSSSTDKAACFQGVSCVLFDDGLRYDGQIPYNFHDEFLPNPSKRIVRIESLAEDIMQMQSDTTDAYGNNSEESFSMWYNSFQTAIVDALEDPQVAGFKTVMCYRGGLKWTKTASFSPYKEQLIKEFEEYIEAYRRSGSKRLERKTLVNSLVQETCARIALSPKAKPLQIHTGFGDTDIDLRKSNAAYLDKLIRKYPNVQFVLLHANYPYVREAGYLATVFSNVYLDISLVFPMISRDGQKAVIKQALELVPNNKLLYSSDAHLLPEGFSIANRQVREVLEQMLVKRVQRGDLSTDIAVRFVKNAFFDTANTLYGLNLETDYGESLTVPQCSPPLKFDDIFGHLPSFRFLRASFVDYCGQVRLRVLPYSQVKKIFDKSSISLPQASLSLLPDDTPSSYTSPIGRWNMILDWSSVRSMHSVAPGHVSVMSWLAPEKGRLEVDPRTVLQQALESALRSDLKFLVGFESEFVLFDRKDDGTLTIPRGGHAWSNTIALTKRHTEVLDEIVTALEDSGIEVMMYHPESASCQFEIVTGPLEPMAAVDALYHTRQIIQGIAAKHNMRSTFHPKPFAQKTGTGTHTHISLSRRRELQNEFFAGVLEHLEALHAFGLATKCSYDRLRDNCWAGGTWISWGEENRETPLRRIDEPNAHWEIRCIDGTANMYLFMAAVIQAGLLGVREHYALMEPCNRSPADLSDDERKELGIYRRVPTDLDSALKALQADTELVKGLGQSMVDKYAMIKKSELAKMQSLKAEERFEWEVERY